MKILIAHNEYGKRSGEESVVDSMDSMFRGLGHDVARLTMSTAGVRDTLTGKIRTFTAGIHSPAGIRAMREALEREQPDVVNVHNLYPFISPAALRECRRAGIPVIMTVHNFRLICPTGLFMRAGAPCELCLDAGNEWNCVRCNCEQSWPKSVAYAARNAVARLQHHYADCVTKFACITEFQRSKLIKAGFDPSRIVVIPNSVPEPAEEITPAGNGKYAGFVGRLSHEKGIDLIVEAARTNPDIHFRLAGAVGDASLVANLPANVELAGFVSGDTLAEFYRGSRFIIMASRCYEGFPMSILEAASYGRPVVAPGHGGFSEIVGDGEEPIGKLFHPGNAEDLAAKIRELWDNPAEATRLGQAARHKLQNRYATPVVAAQWADLLRKINSTSQL